MPSANPPRHVTCDDPRSDDKEDPRTKNGECSPHSIRRGDHAPRFVRCQSIRQSPPRRTTWTAESNPRTVTEVHCSPYRLGLSSQTSMNLKLAERLLESRPEKLTATTSITRGQIAKRRSSRIALSTPVGVSGEDRQKCPFTMPATATNLNRHGAAIRLPRELSVGSTVMVRNTRGTQVSARVVSQLAASHGVSVYAIEFVEQDDAANNFWGITFPPIASRAAIAEQTGMARRRRTIASFQS